LGWVGESRKAELISESDFLLSPSEYEGSSMSVIESMVSGLPCLVSKASKETVGIGGLVMDKDPETWSKAIIGFLEVGAYAKLVSDILEESKKYSPARNQSMMGEIYNSLTN
jgi:glycosyltransferase involved in cell wall biosynthesis